MCIRDRFLDPKPTKFDQKSEIWARMGPAWALEEPEKCRKKIYIFNKSLDQSIVSPLSSAYVNTIPYSVRKSVSNHLEWMDTPSIIVNSALQMNLENTILASAKFMLNGLSFGFYDFDNNETKIDKKDLGSTLAKFNVPEGPFLMIPLLGPSPLWDPAYSDRRHLDSRLLTPLCSTREP